jgi:hypothetical protein
MKSISESEAYQMYEDMIDECNDEVNISGLTYNPSYVLKNVDPIAYRCGFVDFLDAMDFILEDEAIHA